MLSGPEPNKQRGTYNKMENTVLVENIGSLKSEQKGSTPGQVSRSLN
jgi:hypothetical protein